MQTTSAPTRQAIRRAIETLSAHQRDILTIDGVQGARFTTARRGTTRSALLTKGLILDSTAYTILGNAVARELADQARADAPTGTNAVLTETIGAGDHAIPAGTRTYARHTDDDTVEIWTDPTFPFPTHSIDAVDVTFDADSAAAPNTIDPADITPGTLVDHPEHGRVLILTTHRGPAGRHLTGTTQPVGDTVDLHYLDGTRACTGAGTFDIDDDDVHCRACGNTPEVYGFHPCEPDGTRTADDFPPAGWGAHRTVVCGRCGATARPALTGHAAECAAFGHDIICPVDPATGRYACRS